MPSYLLLLLLVSYSLAQDQCRRFGEYADQVNDIISKMTLEQKIGQMTQADIPQIATDHKIDPTLVQKYQLGSLLIGGNFIPGDDLVYYDDYLDLDSFPKSTPQHWKQLGDAIFKPTQITDSESNVLYEIYPFLGSDAVHGNQHVIGEVLFPHNIGLSATHDSKCFKDAGYFMAKSLLATGFNYAFAPTVAVSHNFQWGRHYETMGTDPEWIQKYAAAFVEGAQAYDSQSQTYKGVLSSTKHFLGDGATWWGVDEGNATVYNYKTFLKHNYGGYKGAIDSCTGNVMSSYSAINRIPMAANAELLQGVLKEGMFEGKPFDGFIISDYDEIGRLSSQGWPTTNIKMSTVEAIALMINSGVDMTMLASTHPDVTVQFYQNTLKTLVEENLVNIDRINDAVFRILTVKAGFGLINLPQPSEQTQFNNEAYTTERVGFMEESNPSEFQNAWEAALNCAQKSLVLLKNDKSLLPLEVDKIKFIVLAGERVIPQIYDNQSERKDTLYQDFDNIGAQNGGWTLRWQGFEGNQWWEGDYKDASHATSILDSLKAKFPNAMLLHTTYSDATNMDEVKSKRQDLLNTIGQNRHLMTPENTVIIGVLAESPYAEMMGDINNPMCDRGFGCLYSILQNAYVPDTQRKTLDIGYDDFSKTVIKAVNQGMSEEVPTISVLISGRPMIVGDTLDSSKAFIAAWLPGTQGGEAIVSAITGDYLFRGGDESNLANTLPVQWIKEMSSLENYPEYSADGALPTIKNALFEAGYGLVTKEKKAEAVEA